MKYYYFTGYGNFSHDYGWDNGCSYLFQEMGTEEEFITEPSSWFSDVREIWFNEHEGSRSSDLLIRAENLCSACTKAEEYVALVHMKQKNSLPLSFSFWFLTARSKRFFQSI